MSQAASEICSRCGARLSFVRIGTSEGLVNGWSCWRCGHWDQLDDRLAPRRSAPQRLDKLVQCAVEGCAHMVQVSTTITGRCHRCNRMMFDWERSAKTKPAPIIQVAGVWIFNPARQKKRTAQ